MLFTNKHYTEAAKSNASCWKTLMFGVVLMWRAPHTTTSCMARVTQAQKVWGRGMYLEVNHASHPKRAEFQRPPPHFGGFLYLCLHCLTQNDQIRHGKAYGEVTKYVRDYPIFFNLALHLTGGRVINADPELSCRPLVTHWSLTGHPWSLTGVFVPFGFRG